MTRTAVVRTKGVVVKIHGDGTCRDRRRGCREEKKEKGREKGKKGVELPNNPFSSQQNYCFTHGVVFVSKIVCLLIISHFLNTVSTPSYIIRYFSFFYYFIFLSFFLPLHCNHRSLSLFFNLPSLSLSVKQPTSVSAPFPISFRPSQIHSLISLRKRVTAGDTIDLDGM
jgi:hypothetical protein